LLPKRRQLEIYLNVVEWATGEFGAEPRLQPASGQSPPEAALLGAAAILTDDN